MKQRITELKQRIQNTERHPGDVLLLAVSKQQSPENIEEAYDAGIHDFGENYYQEAEAKILALKHLAITWHFIGPIQSNKTKGIARYFDWVHSIDRLKIATLLDHYRAEHPKPLNVCIQVNLLQEPTKSGVMTQDVVELASSMSQLPHLKLRGFMMIPPPIQNEEQQLEIFQQLKNLLDETNKRLGLAMDTLSMGMSDDWQPAIAAGATIIRIGTAIFGGRKG